MEEVKQWFKDNGIALGSLAVTGGLGFLFGRRGRKKLIRHSIMRENQAYLIGTKDGAIKTLEAILKSSHASVDKQNLDSALNRKETK